MLSVPGSTLFFRSLLVLPSTQSYHMPPARNMRGAQPTSSGLGLHFTSPKKCRDPKKTQTFVSIPGVDVKHKRLLDQMTALMSPPVLATETPIPNSTPPQSEVPMNIDDTSYIDDTMDYVHDADLDDHVIFVDQSDTGAPCPTDMVCEDPGRRLLPNKASKNLHSAWKVLIPTLVDAHLKYSARTHGQPLPELHAVISACARSRCVEQRRFSIICLFFDRKSFISSSSFNSQLQVSSLSTC